MNEAAEQYLRECRLERLVAIRDISQLFYRMEELGEDSMGNLTYREAQSFHAVTDRFRRLVERLALSLPD